MPVRVLLGTVPYHDSVFKIYQYIHAAPSPRDRNRYSFLGNIIMFNSQYACLTDLEGIDTRPFFFNRFMDQAIRRGLLRYPMEMHNPDNYDPRVVRRDPKSAPALELLPEPPMVKGVRRNDGAGWIFVEHPSIRARYGVRRVSRRVLNIARQELRGEIARVNQWLRGDTYGYTEEVSGSVVRSCRNIYGIDWVNNGMLEHVPPECRKAFLRVRASI